MLIKFMRINYSSLIKKGSIFIPGWCDSNKFVLFLCKLSSFHTIVVRPYIPNIARAQMMSTEPQKKEHTDTKICKRLNVNDEWKLIVDHLHQFNGVRVQIFFSSRL